MEKLLYFSMYQLGMYYYYIIGIINFLLVYVNQIKLLKWITADTHILYKFNTILDSERKKLLYLG